MNISWYQAGIWFLSLLKEQSFLGLWLSITDCVNVFAFKYLFLKYSEGEQSDFLKNRYDSKVSVLTKILEEGSENGDLYCEDCALTARNIMYTMEGLKIGAATFGVTEKEIDMHLLYILSGLIVEE